MPTTRTTRASLLPLLLLASGTASRCELSTDAGTGELHLRGTVRFIEAESGCWQLETDDGRRYELHPEQAPAAVLHDGARVHLIVHPGGGRPRACRSAVPVEVRRVVSM